jgi:hypothetical protein
MRSAPGQIPETLVPLFDRGALFPKAASSQPCKVIPGEGVACYAKGLLECFLRILAEHLQCVMRLRDIVRRVVVDARKLTDYALDPENPIGRHKAMVFDRRLGFTRDNYALLLQQVEARALDTDAHLQRTDQHGQHYRVDLEVTGTEGQQEIVRTGWLVAPESDEARLVTLYVRRR